MLLTGKALFLGRRHDLSIHHQRRGGIMVESRNSKDFHERRQIIIRKCGKKALLKLVLQIVP